MPDLYPLVRPLFWSLPTERAHRLALGALRAGLGGLASTGNARLPDSPVLGQTLWGLHFRNPIGVAAGFDKDGLAPEAILRLGFGCIEVGTVTPKPQHGNSGNRLFRLDADRAIINRMGFPSSGLDVVAKRLARLRQRRGIVGINLGKNAASEDAAGDYVTGIRRMAAVADYLVINVSSPNTPGLRDLQQRATLDALLKRLMAARAETGRQTPLLLKIAPDLSAEERADVAAVSLSNGIDGLVIANTTVARPSGLLDPARDQSGGLSGPALFDLSTELLADMYSLTAGRIPLIGVGGISTADDAYAKIRAGASLVQLHTALIFAGMNLVARLKSGLVERLQADGFSRVAEAVGTGAGLPPTSRRGPMEDTTVAVRHGQSGAAAAFAIAGDMLA
jgi:dihydroorotate dehydrogenase